jgi:hypothetical protein
MRKVHHQARCWVTRQKEKEETRKKDGKSSKCTKIKIGDDA